MKVKKKIPIIFFYNFFKGLKWPHSLLLISGYLINPSDNGVVTLWALKITKITTFAKKAKPVGLLKQN